MPEFWWSELLCSYFVGESWNTSIGFFWGLLRWGKKCSEVRNADVYEAGGDETFHSNRRSCGRAGHWNFGCSLVGLKATLQTGSDTGEGAQEVRGRALVFLFVHSHSLTRRGSVLGQGTMEGGSGKQSQSKTEQNRAKRWLSTYTFGLKGQSIAGAGIRLFCHFWHFSSAFVWFSSVIKTHASKMIMNLRIWMYKLLVC